MIFSVLRVMAPEWGGIVHYEDARTWLYVHRRLRRDGNTLRWRDNSNFRCLGYMDTTLVVWHLINIGVYKDTFPHDTEDPYLKMCRDLVQLPEGRKKLFDSK